MGDLIEVNKNLTQIVRAETIKAKNHKRKQTHQILEEDDFVNTIEHIIQRDFFPAVPAMESVLSGRMPTSSLIATPSKKPPSSTSRIDRPSSTRGSFEDPDTPILTNDQKNNSKSKVGENNENNEKDTPLLQEEQDVGPNEINETTKDPEFAMPAPKPKKEKKEMRLNEFMATHTSEDNESFEQVLDKDKQKLTEKKIWLAEQKEAAERVRAIVLENDPRRTGVLTTWEFKPINDLLFFPQGNYDHNTAPKPRGPPKAIDLVNTRFPGGFYDKPTEIMLQAAASQAAKEGAIGAIPGTPTVGGYKFLRTPSPMPGSGAESPMMTWGDVMGTPLHLEEEDELKDPRESRGPKFKVPATPDREEIHRKLDEKSMQKKRVKKKQSIPPSPMIPRSPAVTRSPALSPAAHLSPAAQSLLKKSRIHQSMSKTDSQLRASYRSPHTTPIFPSGQRKSSRPTPSPLSTPLQTPSSTSNRTPVAT